MLARCQYECAFVNQSILLPKVTTRSYIPPCPLSMALSVLSVDSELAPLATIISTYFF